MLKDVIETMIQSCGSVENGRLWIMFADGSNIK